MIKNFNENYLNLTKILLVISLLVSLLLISCSTQPITGDLKVNESLLCSIDSDCVPDSCCHASGAIGIAYAPNCSEMMCSMSCEPGTIDCGLGEVKCVAQKCTVVLLDSSISK